MCNRMPNGNDEARIGKHLADIFQPSDVIVSLGEVARSATEQQQLTNVVAIEVLELRMVAVFAEGIILRRIMQSRKERHPQHFLHRLGTLVRNHDTVLVRSLDREAGRPRRAIAEPVPHQGRMNDGEVTVLVGHDVRVSRKHLQQDRTARASEACDINRLIDRRSFDEFG